MVTITITVTVNGAAFPGAISTVYSSMNTNLGSCVSNSYGVCTVNIGTPVTLQGYIIAQAQGQSVNSGVININADSSYAFNINPPPVDPTGTVLFLGALGVLGAIYLFRRKRRG